MGMIKTLLTGGPAPMEESTSVIFECRKCGTTLNGKHATCPYCGPTDVVCYELT